jgi:curved DNA-binding protein CbpA|uniref:J domain-containing protein n=1 Tax=Eutreptiella gymnastica TaxID=73025 RepID=A0A6T2DZ41_9EUGL|mmetsp:Transcript_107790/g.182255  ORF Transcript_107790/g.182255 Transcript_107790/m.182255 type:complete len:230 (-) Transcript_107790:956-1645(-)
MNPVKDYYDLLGLPHDATSEAIKQAYRAEALKWHPDKNLDRPKVAEARFKLLSEAFQVLTNGCRRAEYDAQLRRRTRAGAASPWCPFAEEFDAELYRADPEVGETLFRYFNTEETLSFDDPRDLFCRFFEGESEEAKLARMVEQLGYDPKYVKVKVRARVENDDGEWGEWGRWDEIGAKRAPMEHVESGQPLTGPSYNGPGYRWKMEQMEMFRKRKAERQQLEKEQSAI